MADLHIEPLTDIWGAGARGSNAPYSPIRDQDFPTFRAAITTFLSLSLTAGERAQKSGISQGDAGRRAVPNSRWRPAGCGVPMA
jgi:hypothetical protein